jgi:hypothetical protein
MKTTDQLIAAHNRQLRALRKRKKDDEARLVAERRDAQRARFAASLGVDPEDLDAMDGAIASIEAANPRRAAATAAYDDGFAAPSEATHNWPSDPWSASDEIGA